MGGLAGICHGYVNNCTVSGTVSGGSYVGGLIGLCGPGCYVTGCSSSATVTGVGAAIGGVFGAANNIFTQADREELGEDGACLGQASLNYCVFTGTVTGTNSSSSAYTTYNEETGTITLHYKDNATGGIVGWCNAFCVYQCRNEGTVNGFDFTGGVVGDCSNEGSVYQCTNYGTVNGGSYLTGGVTGRVGDSSIDSCENHGAVSGWWFTGGVAGFVDKESLIDDAAVGTYCSNMGDVTGTRFTGGVIGISNKRIWGYCTNSATVTGQEYTGGIAGYTTRALSSCDNLAEGKVIGETCTGGIVGCIVNRIYSCKNQGTVTGTAEKTGGVAGWARYTVSDCCNDYTGQVAGVKYTGGVAGRGDGAAETCENKGAVSGSDSFTGGGVGTQPYGNLISYCINAGAVGSGTSNTSEKYVGGIIGTGKNVSNCLNQGTVQGYSDVGGIMGYCLNGGEVKLCRNQGDIHSGTVAGVYQNTGGIVGHLEYPAGRGRYAAGVPGSRPPHQGGRRRLLLRLRRLVSRHRPRNGSRDLPHQVQARGYPADARGDLHRHRTGLRHPEQSHGGHALADRRRRMADRHGGPRGAERHRSLHDLCDAAGRRRYDG